MKNQTRILSYERITVIVDVHKKGGVRPKYDIYIGRAQDRSHSLRDEFPVDSLWANPYPIYQCDGLELFEKKIRAKIKEKPEVYNLDSLIGKLIGCWCRNKYDTCHGQVLLRLLKEKYPKSYYLNDWELVVVK